MFDLESIELIGLLESPLLKVLTSSTPVIQLSGYTGVDDCYAKIVPTFQCVERIKHALKALPNADALPLDELERDPHVTLIYSRETPVSIPAIAYPIKGSPKAKIIDIVYWEGHDKDGYVVLKLDSPDLTKFNQMFIHAGATHSFPDYTPHMTLNSHVGECTDEVLCWIDHAKEKVVGMEILFSDIIVENM